MSVTVHHRIARDDLALGLVRVEGIAAGPAPAALAEALEQWIARRRDAPLDAAEEALRKGSRDILRNGRYKPTGRGKPASEYLLRAAAEGAFPRVSGPVDANNLVSVAHCVPVSVWDLDRAEAARYAFRLGAEGERYVFNPSGQVLELRDLVCGCGLTGAEADEPGAPRVSPVKDSMATKVQPETSRVIGCIYFPLAAGRERLARATGELLGWLQACGPDARGGMALALPGETVTL